MKVKEYFENFGKYEQVTFIKARARKDSSSPYYHPEYQITPIRTINEWSKTKLMDYFILNDKQPPIDWLSGGGWTNQFNNGWLQCLLIISKEDGELLYNEKQFADTIAYIDKVIMNRR